MPRLAETWVELDKPQGSYVELIDLGPTEEGSRAQIPRQARAVVSWLKGWTGGPALLELADPGRIRIRSWKPFGERLLVRRQELSARSEEDDIAELVGLAERYRRVTIEKNGRFPLHHREQSHLGLGPSSGWCALLICSPEYIELWSEDFRRRWRDQNKLDLSWLRDDAT